MYYIIQKNTFKEKNYNTIIDTLNRFDLEYEIIDVLPFTDEIKFKTDRKDVIIFGSLKLARLAKKEKWLPGSFANDNHDYNVYSKYYGNNLLNSDSIIQNFTVPINWNTPKKFIRPTEDTKTFTGKVFNQEEWEEFVHYSLTNGHETTLCDNTPIQVASVKQIQKEYRFWIVDGQVITGSLYKLGYRIVTDANIEDDAIKFAEKMISKFQLANAFVLDVCLVDDEWKIVECGCMNCAGFYAANMNKVIIALEELFD